MKAFFSRVGGIILRWAKAEVAFVLPLLSEYSFDALSRLAEVSAGEQVLYTLVYAALVWLVPNKQPALTTTTSG